MVKHNRFISTILFFLFAYGTQAQIVDSILAHNHDTSIFNIHYGQVTAKANNRDITLYGNWSAGEALMRMPYMQVYGQMGFYSEAHIGGLESQYQSVKINGLRPGGGQDNRDFRLDRIPSRLLSAAALTYNPTVLLGADAPIGLVCLELIQPPAEQQFMADVSVKNTNSPIPLTSQMTISYGDTRGKWSFIAGYSINSIDRLNRIDFTDTTVTGTSENRIKNLVNGLTTTIIYRPDSKTSFQLQTVYSQIDDNQSATSTVHPLIDGTLEQTPDTTRIQNQLFLHAHTFTFVKQNKKHRFNWETTFAQHKSTINDWHYSQNSTDLLQAYTDEWQKNTQIASKAEWEFHKQYGQTKLTYINGIYYDFLYRNYERSAYSKVRKTTYWDNITDESYLLYENHPQIYTGTNINLKNWELNLALRAELDYGIYRASNNSVNTYSFNLNPSVNGRYLITSNFSMNAGLSRHITRAPYNLLVPVDKVYNSTQTVIRGNPELNPSTSWNFSAGFHYNHKNVAQVGVTTFYTALSNVFELKPSGTHPDFGYQIYQTVNIDSGQVWGAAMEVSKTLSLTQNFETKLWGALTFLNSSVYDAYLQNIRRINKQPAWLANANLQFGFNKPHILAIVGVMYTGKAYTGAQFYNEVLAPRITHSAYWQVNARLQYHPTPKLQVYLIGSNLTRQTQLWYQSSLSAVGKVGLSIEVGARYAF